MILLPNRVPLSSLPLAGLWEMNESLRFHFCPLWCPQDLARVCFQLGRRVSESLGALETQCLLKLRGGDHSRVPLCRVEAGGGARALVSSLYHIRQP